MSITVFLVVPFAAAMHATWNAIVKSGTDKFFTGILVTASAGLIRQREAFLAYAKKHARIGAMFATLIAAGAILLRLA